MHLTPRRIAALAACTLTAAAFACEPIPPAPAQSQCDTALAEAANQETFWDTPTADDSQTAADVRAHIAEIRAACQPTTTTVPDTSTSAPETTTTAPATTTVPETTTTTQPPTGGYPTESTTGTPPGWQPTEILSSDLTVTAPGTVIQDVRMVRGNIWVRAANVTIRRVDMQGGRINNSCCINQPYDGQYAGTSAPGMLVEDVTFSNPPGVTHTPDVYYRLGDSNYTARRVKILDQLEGFRTGAKDWPGAGEVVIEDSYVRLDTTTIVNVGCGGHPDGVQGYVGAHATIRHNTIDLYSTGGSCENGAVFIADSSAGADVINNLLLGGAFTLRAHDGPFRLIDNVIANNTWQYGPLTCDGNGAVGYQIVEQFGNRVAEVDNTTYQVGATVRTVAC
jgi:hypothetical protein